MKWYYNMKIGIKLIIAFLIVAFLAGAIGVIGIINLRSISSLDKKLYETMTVPLGEMVVYVEAYQGMQGDVKNILLSTNGAKIQEYEKRIKERNEDFDRNLESFGKTLLTEEGKKLTQMLFDYKKQYDEIIDNIIKLVNENKREQAISLLNGDAEKIGVEMEQAYERMMEIKVTAAQNTVDGNSKTADDSITYTVIILIAGMALSIFLGIFISTSIKKPLNKLVGASERIADGDLDVKIDIDTGDEIGILAKAFRKMTVNINDAMNKINNAAEQVAAGARQVSDSSLELSQGATEQASSIEELTASLEEISSQTKLNAQNANQANELAETAKNNAEIGNKQMSGMLKAMEEINDSSANISKIIKVIDEIAFQTNILALNAAVEAARAGQHGKGFAVVAEEVRNLAARSANAAKETTDLIEGSIKKTENGTKIASETAQALNKIVDDVAKAAFLVGDIAVASNEQASGIAQINQGIMQVSQVVQSNSATAEESAAASEELSSQAELLRESVGKFRLKKARKEYARYEDLSPEVLKMLENMSEMKNFDKAFSEEARSEAAASRHKIVLSDKEFGKY